MRIILSTIIVSTWNIWLNENMTTLRHVYKLTIVRVLGNSINFPLVSTKCNWDIISNLTGVPNE